METEVKIQVLLLVLCSALVLGVGGALAQDEEEEAYDDKEVEQIESELTISEEEVKKEMMGVIPYPGVNPEKGGIAPLIERARKSKINVVTWPGFQMLPAGIGSRVFVQILKGSTIDKIGEPARIDKPPFKVGPNTLVYLFPESTVLLRNNYNPLIMKYFNTPVLKARMKKFKKRVYLVLEMKADVLPLREKFVNYKDDFYFFFIEFEPGFYLPAPPAAEEKQD